MNRIVILLCTVILCGNQYGAAEQCAVRVECINATAAEECWVREAVPQVVQFYRELGFEVPDNLQLRFRFQSSLCLNGQELDYALGIFNPGTNTVFMCSYKAAAYANCRMFGSTGSAQLYRSILVHETAHFINSVIAPGLHPTIDEAVAATVQFSLMESNVRRRISGAVDAPRFTSYRDISMGAYLYSPEGFLLACYAYMQAHPTVLKRCLNSRTALIKDPFLIEWN